MLDIGSLDRFIRIDKCSNFQDAMGGIVKLWTYNPASYKCYAKIEYKSAKTTDDENKINAVQNVEFTIRGSSVDAKDINANSHRVAYPVNALGLNTSDTQYYIITGVSMIGGREKWKCLITELTTNTSPQT
jgi:head-tail adaptor